MFRVVTVDAISPLSPTYFKHCAVIFLQVQKNSHGHTHNYQPFNLVVQNVLALVSCQQHWTIIFLCCGKIHLGVHLPVGWLVCFKELQKQKVTTDNPLSNESLWLKLPLSSAESPGYFYSSHFCPRSLIPNIFKVFLIPRPSLVIGWYGKKSSCGMYFAGEFDSQT